MGCMRTPLLIRPATARRPSRHPWAGATFAVTADLGEQDAIAYWRRGDTDPAMRGRGPARWAMARPL